MKNDDNIQRTLLLLGFLAAFILIWRLWHEGQHQIKNNPEFTEWKKKYPETIKQRLLQSQELVAQSPPTMEINKTNTQVTNNQFEGAQIKLHAIEHWGKIHQKQTHQMADFGPNYCLFDPDHPRLGMPDIEVHVTPVKMYQPGQDKLGKKMSAFFNMIRNDKPKPYKTFKKKIEVPATADEKSKTLEVEMQMWLMQFEVTLGAKPDMNKKKDLKLRKHNGELPSYPSHWYNKSEGNRISTHDLEEEYKNQRYGNLKLWLEINPNKSPFYINNASGKNEQHEAAIGAVYCMELAKKPNDEMSLIASSVLPGKELSLYAQPDFSGIDEGIATSVREDFDSYVGSSRNDTTGQSIWNKPYYVKLFLKNFGTWKEGIFNHRKYHDQITYTFLMPLLVEGSWDVIPPTELLPEWSPPEPYFKSASTLLPHWNWRFGKFISSALIFTIGLAMLILLFPNLLASFTRFLLGLFKK